MLRRNRSVWVGAGVGFTLGMPMFEVVLLTALAVDGGWFHATFTTRYLSQTENLLGLLLMLHLVTGAVGAVVGRVIGRMNHGRRLVLVAKEGQQTPCS